MERLTSDVPVPAALRNAVVALGNFDGFHRGHQAVVGRAREIARAEGRPLIVATFSPHPSRIFHPEAPFFRLTTIDQRARLFAAAGADAMLVFNFDRALAAVSADDFVTEWLIGRVGAAVAVTGEDFTFGAQRSGNVKLLKEVGKAGGLRTEAVGPVSDADGPVSSSRIREALQNGDCETATRLLSRPFAIEGVVQHGDKLGRSIGFPTANIPFDRYLRPAFGIYAVRGHLADGRIVDGAANLGLRPTFDPPKELFEPHFFDFSGDLYGQTIEVDLIHFIRPEAKYDTLDALTAQIAADCAEAKRVLALNPLTSPRT
ncbi:MAG: bifunctional riboflavin kinase/FAD synthetase [Sphingomonadaceae bacterium]